MTTPNPPQPEQPAQDTNTGKAPQSEPQNGSGTRQNDSGGQGKPPKFEGEYDPDKAARLVTNLRSEVETERTKRTELETKFTAFMDNFAKLFGGDSKQELTPEQITQKAQESDQQAREATTKLAVFQVAGKHGADPEALLDSASFVRAVGKLDPAADTFAANVESAIKAAVEKSPRLKAGTTPAVPAKGGFDMTGSSNGKRQLTAAEVAKLSPEQIVKAREDGLLDDYLAS